MYFFNIHRPYEVRKIMNTNLILLVVKELCPNQFEHDNFDTVPQEVDYEVFNNSLNCHKAIHSLPRCRPKTVCIRTHPDVNINTHIYIHTYMQTTVI